VWRDKTFEEFMSEFKDHLEGKVDPTERIGERPETVAWDPLNPPATKNRSNFNKKDLVNPLEEEEKSELAKLES
jgi:hypothetical protein